MAMMDELAAALSRNRSAQMIYPSVVVGWSRESFFGWSGCCRPCSRQSGEMLTKFHDVVRALVGTKKVTIAAVHGHCLGGGAELAMVCDIVYTADDAVWGFPEIKLGCYPPVAATALAALVGQKHAADLILTGRRFPERKRRTSGWLTVRVRGRGGRGGA